MEREVSLELAFNKIMIRISDHFLLFNRTKLSYFLLIDSIYKRFKNKC